MTGTEYSTILKQMGITQWLLRDAPPEPGDSGAAGLGVIESTEPDTPDKPSKSMPAERSEPIVPPQGGLSTQPVSETGPETPTSSKPLLSTIQTLRELRVEVAQCTACKLAQSRTNTVFGSGPEQSDWLFVGEAPGQQEDRQGKPFVGRAGSLLTQMLLALGQQREQVFIANTLKCRPPGNRDPLPEELQACEPLLLKQIELVKPKVMVALGRISAQALLNSDQPLGKLRGQIYRYGSDNIPLIVTYHPAYLLRNPADKARVWEDLLLANRQLPG